VYSGLQFKTTKGLELNSQGVFRSSVQNHKRARTEFARCIPVFSSNPGLVWERYCLCTVQVWLIQTGRRYPTAIVKRPMSCTVL